MQLANSKQFRARHHSLLSLSRWLSALTLIAMICAHSFTFRLQMQTYCLKNQIWPFRRCQCSAALALLSDRMHHQQQLRAQSNFPQSLINLFWNLSTLSWIMKLLLGARAWPMQSVQLLLRWVLRKRSKQLTAFAIVNSSVSIICSSACVRNTSWMENWHYNSQTARKAVSVSDPQLHIALASTLFIDCVANWGNWR